MNFSYYSAKEINEVLKELETSIEGLTEEAAKERQKIYGLNEIKYQETTLFNIFVRQFKSSFFYLLFIASLISFLVGERINALIILCFVLINTTLSFFQESRAVKAAALLKKYAPLKVRVKRNGQEKIIEQKFLVPGDIVLLEVGNIVPADLRLIKVNNFWVNEEVLSGESSAVAKNVERLAQPAKEIFQATNIVFAASAVVSGEAEGVVINTGQKTFFGEVAKLITREERKSVYEKDLSKFANLVLKIVVSSIIVVFLLNLIIKGTVNFFDFLIFCIALIVGIIPEALPAVVTFAFSQGALALAKEKVVVKRLSAIEDLGNIEILCTDKTGTLTENKLSLAEIYSSDKEKCLLYGLLSSAAVKEEIESSQSSFDVALQQKSTPDLLAKMSEFKVIAEMPFDNNRWRSSTLVEDEEGKKILIVKGAPEVILQLCSQFEKTEKPAVILEEIKKEGRAGKRVLALAYKTFRKQQYSEKDENDLKFLGYFSFVDPLKKTAIGAIKLAEKLGVQVKILTGDTAEVAGAVGKEIGLVQNPQAVLLGEELESLDDEALARACEQFHIFARLSPQMKFRIVEALQKKFIVGFLGEGINDAPPLKIAQVALVVETGADIAREVADIILLKKDLRVIVDGIKQGRNIFANVNKYIKCTLASNFGNFYSIALISLFIPFLPMLPSQILLVNLVSDFPLIAVSSDKVDVEELRRPRVYQLNRVILLIILLALTSSCFDVIFFLNFYRANPQVLQTLWFMMSVLTEIALIFSIRTRRFFLKARRPSFSLIILSLLAITLILILPFTQLGQNFFQFIAPPQPALFFILFLVLLYFGSSELVKLLFFRFFYRKNNTQ